MECGRSEEEEIELGKLRYLRSMDGVNQVDRMRKEEMVRRAEVVRELADQAMSGVLRWFHYVEKLQEGSLMKKITGPDVRDRPRGRYK